MLPDLAALDQLRLLNLDDVRLAMPAISVDLSDLSARLAMMDLGQTATVAAQASAEARAAREASNREAIEASRDSMRLAQTYTYDYRMGGGDYNAGKDLMNRRQYEQAIRSVRQRSSRRKGERVDGALYHKAYSQYKLGKMEDALATIATLRKEHPQSAYLQDAKVLESDARRMSGKPVNPADVDDDELKILAINGLLRHRSGSSG
jgi:TolA-binding protein